MGYTNTIMTIAILVLDGLIGARTAPSLAFKHSALQVMALGVFKLASLLVLGARPLTKVLVPSIKTRMAGTEV